MMVNVAIISNLIVDTSHHVAGDGQPDPFIAARLGKNKRINADYAATGIHQRSATIAGINRCIRLDVDGRTVWIKLSGDGTHNPHAYRIIETQWAAKSQYQLSLLQVARIR